MRCPHCSHDVTEVKDSRPTGDGGAIRRRRICPDCDGRFTTYERPYMRDLWVAKKGCQRQLFDRDKLARSIRMAAARRPIAPDVLESVVSKVCLKLERLGQPEVASVVIGTAVLQELRHVDNVAFVRYASVYLDFKFATDFADFLAQEGLAHRGKP